MFLMAWCSGGVKCLTGREFDCPFARHNEHYPFEGNCTEHRCLIKPCGLVCDFETVDGCVVYEWLKRNPEVMSKLKGWMKRF